MSNTQGPLCNLNGVKLIWFPLQIPKPAMIYWMATLIRLSTKDHSLSWRITPYCACVLCQPEQEFKNYLFFKLCSLRKSQRIFYVNANSKKTIPGWEEEQRWAVRYLSSESSIRIVLSIARTFI
uniref:Reverse transcriptase zinc-binding domain-containing protein n=1 Tax=Gossypium raimondii TaxID=29730 RepID=A0A0D2SDM5_GOSRA|nr:hypothetical protein B456_005G093600 [Gossypium raimondii]